MEEETQKTGMNKNMIMVGIAVVIIIAAVAIGGLVLSKNKEQAVVETPQDTTGTIQETSEQGAMTGNYKDGTYEAVGEYSYHSGTESIDVTVTLKGGVIENVDVVAQAKAPISKKIQEDFIANYKEQVVGKNIDEVKLGKISGSSLTPIGFNTALEEIKAQAQASS